jgi:D-amino peptidase
MKSKHALVWPMAIGLMAAGTAATGAQDDGLKLFISVDMEGVVGVVTDDHLGPEGFEYQQAREWMTEELLAAINAARAEGVTEIVVADSHGNGENILIDRLPEDVTIVRSWPRPLGMMQGIDETFDAAIFLGYHAGTSNPEGVRAHTFSSAKLADVSLNGDSMPEGGVNAAIAGHFGVPVIMISGDDAAVEQVTSIVGDMEGAVVKWAYSFHSARTMTPAASYKLIGEKVTNALQRLGDFEPFVMPSPITLDVRFKSYRPSELLAYLPIVERTDSHSIRYEAQDMVELSKFLQFMNGYSSGLEP